RTPMPLSKARARLLKAKRRVHQSIQKELKGANELGLERRLSGENSMQIGMYYDKIGAAWAADVHYSVAQTTYKAAKGHFVYALDKISNSDGGEVFQGSALQKTLEKNLAELEQAIEQLEKHLEGRKGSVPPLPSSTPLALLE
ncbi:MAG: hypothetical protein AAFQ08_04020, partial [Bacteroidota bacterium]